MRPRASVTTGFAGCSGTTAPQDEQNKSPAFSAERQTRQNTQDSSIHPQIRLAKYLEGTSICMPCIADDGSSSKWRVSDIPA
jgi:hypothetical protein